MILFLFISPLITIAQWQSEWVYYNSQGKLSYKSDPLGNKIPDFSMVGYKGGLIDLPKSSVQLV